MYLLIRIDLIANQTLFWCDFQILLHTVFFSQKDIVWLLRLALGKVLN